MIGNRDVGDVRAADGWQVAGGTVVLGALLTAGGQRQATSLVRVTAQAAVAVERDALLRSRQAVRVVTGNTAEPAATALKAAAGVHLLDVADYGVIRAGLTGPDKDRPEVVQR